MVGLPTSGAASQPRRLRAAAAWLLLAVAHAMRAPDSQIRDMMQDSSDLICCNFAGGAG